MEALRIDKYTLLDEIVQSVVSEDDVSKRADIIKTACEKHRGFKFLILQEFSSDRMTFKDVIENGGLIVRTVKHGNKHTLLSYQEILDEISQYNDKSYIRVRQRRNKLIALLDWLAPDDLPYLMNFFNGERIFPLKINHRVCKLALPGELGE